MKIMRLLPCHVFVRAVEGSLMMTVNTVIRPSPGLEAIVVERSPFLLHTRPANYVSIQGLSVPMEVHGMNNFQIVSTTRSSGRAKSNNRGMVKDTEQDLTLLMLRTLSRIFCKILNKHTVFLHRLI